MLHVFIDATLMVGFFSYQILIAYLAWVAPDRLDALLARLRHRFTGGRSRLDEEPLIIPASMSDGPDVTVTEREQETLPLI
jgi:hypothetical protein